MAASACDADVDSALHLVRAALSKKGSFIFLQRASFPTRLSTAADEDVSTLLSAVSEFTSPCHSVDWLKLSPRLAQGSA